MKLNTRKDERPVVPCEICGTDTTSTGSKRCDRCWELETRIMMNPDLARKILAGLKQSETPAWITGAGKELWERFRFYDFGDNINSIQIELFSEIIKKHFNAELGIPNEKQETKTVNNP